MVELTSIELNPDTHILLDQPLLRTPYNLSRQTFKAAQRLIEHQTHILLKDISVAAQSASASASPSKSISDLDSILAKLHTLQRKLSTLHEDEKRHIQASKSRISHLSELYNMQSLVDVKYDAWSRTRLSRLLVDYLLRQGYFESAKALAGRKGIEELVDVEAFMGALRIEKSLREGRDTREALAWCKENAQLLKKVGGEGLEYQLRLQQYVELVRQGHEMARERMRDEFEFEEEEEGEGEAEAKFVEARAYARRFLVGNGDLDLLGRVAGLLAYRPDPERPTEPYASLYSDARWAFLAGLFLQTHHNLYSLPPRPLLHSVLSAGLSALKTPSCHSKIASSSANSASSTTTVCPICSTELNELARNVPYAQHRQSVVEDDPVVLPNGRIYGRRRLEEWNEKTGTAAGWVRDPMGDPLGWDESTFKASEVEKVFIM
ncbi:hypothetical protein M011DRAFT_458194 [Sporormia fimetaria CBS 119925]|uniref:Protein FYV10 n=1 Tax=Sporormia fimetaria CBS 119925 TaxID=1340428 RepID=A0A6A6VDZ9_9PLEO|nr:hypothetical protein M011DRAFT_458194 [Sporormia fimetaria CBS 119925]